MDADTGNWVLEFLIGKRIVNNTIIEQIVRKIPVAPNTNNFYFKKTLLLRVLQENLTSASIEESMLEILEILEELLHSEGSAVTAAFPAAYCAVAVECTLKYLKSEVSIPRYFDAVKTIWCERVSNLKPSPSCEKRSLLFSDELDRWRIDIEASLNDPCVRDRLALAATENNTRSVAIDRLNVLVADLWESVDPSFLELAVENEAVVAADRAEEALRLPPQEEEQQRETEKDNRLLDGNCITNPAEQMDPPTTCESDVPPTTTNAHAHDEWDAFVDELEEGTSTRLQLPSPKRERVFPLKKYEPTNFIKRRKTRRWSQLEEETLEEAVNKFGTGNWKLMLNAHKDVFEERTDVDLKDKWRNMMRHRRK